MTTTIKTIITATTFVVLTSTMAMAHDNPDAHTNECQSAIPYPGWGQVDVMYSKPDGTFFKATASAEGITHTRYTSSCVVLSVTFLPFGKDKDDVVVGGTTTSNGAPPPTAGNQVTPTPDDGAGDDGDDNNNAGPNTNNNGVNGTSSPGNSGGHENGPGGSS